MTSQEFERYSTALQQRLQTDEQVLALIALGSMAEPHRADAWSDHDFWVVTAPGKDDTSAFIILSLPALSFLYYYFPQQEAL